MIAWHYTTGKNFRTIVRTGLLLPATKWVRHPELPIVWFSTHPEYEPSAIKSISGPHGQPTRKLTLIELYQRGGGLVRFGCPVERLKRGEQLRKAANMRSSMWRALVKAAKLDNPNPNDWWGHVGYLEIEGRQCRAGRKATRLLPPSSTPSALGRGKNRPRRPAEMDVLLSCKPNRPVPCDVGERYSVRADFTFRPMEQVAAPKRRAARPGCPDVTAPTHA